jgi:predicted PurR-regulated permease PerM
MTNASTSVYAKLVNPLICIAVTLGLLYYGQSVLKPLALSALLAILLTSPCRYFERQGFPRAISALMMLLLAVVIFFLIFYVIMTAIVSFRDDLPQMKENINASVQQMSDWAKPRLSVSTQKMQEIIKASAANIVPKTSYVVNRALTTVSSVIIIGILIIIQTFLLLLYRGLIVNFFMQLFEAKYAALISELFRQMRYVVRGYISALFIEMLIIAFANCAMMYALGIKYALLLGIIAAVLNIIPYLGIVMGIGLSALISLTTNTPMTVMWMSVSLIVIHMLDTNVLMPNLVRARVNINALATIVGVIIGTTVWGVPGTFMAVPLLAIMKLVFEAVPQWQPFALLMGDDSDLTSVSRKAFRRVASRMRPAKKTGTR